MSNWAQLDTAQEEIFYKKLLELILSWGSLTSLERDEWADIRNELMEAGNAQNVNLVDSALFALCLDDLKSQDPKRYVLT